MATGSSPYRRPRRTLDYGAVARQQIRVMPLRKRIEARRRQRGMREWEVTPLPLVRRRQRTAPVVTWVVTWAAICLVVFVVVAALTPWLLVP